MYWPLGTPRIYAASSGHPRGFTQQVSRDGLPASHHADGRGLNGPHLLGPSSTASQDALGSLPAPTPITPVTPATPLTPGIKSVEFGDYDEDDSGALSEPAPSILPREAILALRVARSGHIFAVITPTCMTIWQTKVERLPSMPATLS